MIGDRYRIIDTLGAGASAQTLLCADTHASDRQVALKLLRVERLQDWKYFELFEREARVLASLDHPGIPKLLDFFEIQEEGQPRLALVQEYIQGESLATRIARSARCGDAEVIQWVLGILDILDYLHGCRPPVYHRDIKPSNILIRPMGAPVLIDFGSVCDGWRPADEAGSTIVGTHGFMPPEQYLGQVGPTSDLYALGATLLNVLTGRLPRDFSFESGRIEVPEDLPGTAPMRALLVALLEPAPRQRPQSARQARDILLQAPLATPNSAALVPTRDAPPAINQADDDAPRFVHLGPPGRDPRGDFAMVYRNLVPPHLRTLQVAGGKPSRPPNPMDYAFYTLMTLVTVGLWPLICVLVGLRRKQRHHPLFVDGAFAEGRLVAATTSNEGGATLTYDFEVDGQSYRNQSHYPTHVARYLGIGDKVGVLYDPDNPRKSCLAFA